MKKVFSFILALVLTISLNAGNFRTAPARHILETAWNKLDKSLIQPGGDWFPYPAYEDREGWDHLFGNQKEAVIAEGEKYLDYEYKLIRASDYLIFERTGNRARFENRLRENSIPFNSMLMAELAEGKGRFIDQIVDWIWYQTERTTWVASAHQRTQRSKRALADGRDIFIDLASQTTAHMVAITLHFFRKQMDAIDPSISAAVERSLRRNIFDPYMDDSKVLDEHYWLGFRIMESQKKYLNNWTPWCNYNVLMCFLLACNDRDEILRAFDRAVRSTDLYLDMTKLDGGCNEGPKYWAHSSGSVYCFIQLANYATKGAFGCFDDPQVRAMGSYKPNVFLGNGWAANFGDGPARSNIDNDLAYRFGKTAGLKDLMDYSIYSASVEGNFGMWNTIGPKIELFRLLERVHFNNMFKADCDSALAAAGGDVEKMRKQLLQSSSEWAWYPDTEHLFHKDKSNWNFGAKAGYNNESHNHNDVGSCVLYVHGRPVLVDAGHGPYTAKTFSRYRYDIWTMQSCWHNLPTINGIDQKNGMQYTSSDVKADRNKCCFSMNISGAYPETCASNYWNRTYCFKGAFLSIKDKFSLKERRAADIENFLVKGEVFLPGQSFKGQSVKKGEVILVPSSEYGGEDCTILISYPSAVLTPAVETLDLSDGTGPEVWGKSISRIRFKSSEKAPLKGCYSFTFTEKQ